MGGWDGVGEVMGEGRQVEGHPSASLGVHKDEMGREGMNRAFISRPPAPLIFTVKAHLVGQNSSPPPS